MMSALSQRLYTIVHRPVTTCFLFSQMLGLQLLAGCSGSSLVGSPNIAPTAPASLAATSGSGQVALSWKGSAGATSYNVYRSSSSGAETTTPYQSGLSGTTYSDPAVANGSTYFYKVTAINTAGVSPFSNEATGTPKATGSEPAAPTLTAMPENAQITLTWNASANATSYNVFRSSTQGGEGLVPYKAGVTANTFVDTGLTNGTPYYYTVDAINSSGPSAQSNEVTATPSASIISSVTTDLSRYSPGDSAAVTVNLTNTTGTAEAGKVSITVTHLGVAANTLSAQSFTVANGASTALTFAWTPPSTDFTGYLAQVTASDASGTVIGQATTAIDVSSSWVKFPRYGYMSAQSFSNSTVNSTSLMNQLTRFHLDGLMYQDWAYKHHVPLCGTVASPCASWTSDGSGQTVYASAVKSLVTAGHVNNIAAMEYDAIYSALNGQYGFTPYTADGSGVSPSWGLYTTAAGVSGPAANFYQWQYMDPSNTGWQTYIMNQQLLTMQAFGFDGFQGDTFGDFNSIYYTAAGAQAGVSNDGCTTDTTTWNSGVSVNNNAGSPTFINGTFTPFLKYAKTALGSKYLMFNPVSYDRSHCEANTSPADILFSELWANGDGFVTYADLKSAVDTASTESATATGSAKSMVVAAYVDYNPNTGTGSGFNIPDVLFLDATLFASGGSHMEIGDGNNMLNQQDYFSNSVPMTSALVQAVTPYYDFMTAYENLLRDGQTNTTQAVSIAGQTVSGTAKANSVWAFTKSDSSHEIVHLINLLGQSSIDWQTGACGGCTYTSSHTAPAALTNVQVKYYTLRSVKSVSFASPDANGGTTTNLSFTPGSDAGGSYVTFTVPSLLYWDMVYLNN